MPRVVCSYRPGAGQLESAKPTSQPTSTLVGSHIEQQAVAMTRTIPSHSAEDEELSEYEAARHQAIAQEKQGRWVAIGVFIAMMMVAFLLH
jgi:hypothetical protein